MSARSIRDQLLRDLKASWQKSLVLGVLLLVGLVFWVPPLVRAVLPRNPAATATKPAAGATPGQAASPTNAAPASPSGTTPAVLLPTVTWKNADRILQTDPLVQSADVAAIRGNPFRIDHRQFPPPVLFADEPPAPKAVPIAATAPQVEPTARVLPPELVLRSTIVGANRRAAFINRRLYFEGARIEAAGETFLLASVQSRKVVLESRGENFELAIPETVESGEDAAQSAPTGSFAPAGPQRPGADSRAPAADSPGAAAPRTGTAAPQP